jgi:hypothetical protein
MTSDNFGWYADPSGGHELRFFDGRAWTEHVADSGTQSLSPIDEQQQLANATAIKAEAETLAMPAAPLFQAASTLAFSAAEAAARPAPPATAPPSSPPAVPSPPPVPSPVLHKQPRSWRTWQLAAVGAVTLVLGLLLGWSTRSTTRVPVDSPTTVDTQPATTGGGTTVPAPTTTVTVAAGGNVSVAGTGNRISEPFSFRGRWELAWSYSCPNGSAPFQLTIDDASGKHAPGIPTISSTGATGKGTESSSVADNLFFKITTTCSWTVNLSG